MTSPARSPSPFQVGDYVVYRFTGSYRPVPIELTETVIAKEGLRLTILVELRSGNESRSWKQIVTDTPENKRSNHVDQLIERVGGREVALANQDTNRSMT